MRATGIVRRIDDLGRVVIPKEIRRNLHIREGEALEIFTTENGVCFCKYEKNLVEEVGGLRELIESYGDLTAAEMRRVHEMLNEICDLIKSEE